MSFLFNLRRKPHFFPLKIQSIRSKKIKIKKKINKNTTHDNYYSKKLYLDGRKLERF